MFDFIKNLFGGNSTNYADLVKNGALIIDVRSKEEFAAGHLQGSINIPVNALSQNLSKLKDKNQSIITCCASGMRSASAKSTLIKLGYTDVHNGGSWISLKNKISN